ncbi:13474_t:CDS:2, partial [Funneliformis geosporum]
MSNQDYFAENFDPSKVTVKRLKEILSANDIPYKDSSRKAEFIQKFQDHVLPIVELQRRTEAQQQERITDKESRARRTDKEQRHVEEKIAPSVSTTQIKTPHQKKQKSGRASSKKRKEVIEQHVQDEIAVETQQTTTLESAGQSQLKQNHSEKVSPPRTLRAPTSPTPFYPMMPPYSRTPAYPFLEPEELEEVKRKEQELHQSTELDEVSLYPPTQGDAQYPSREGTENRSTTTGNDIIERREAIAYCHKPRAFKRPIDRRPPPEFIKRKTRFPLSLRSIIKILFIIGASYYLYIIFRTNEYCDSAITSHQDVQNDSPTSESINDQTCTPCPNGSICSNGVITECERGFKLEKSYIRFNKPYCVIDKDQMANAKKYTKEFKEMIAHETGRFECEYDKDNLIYKDLKLRLKEKMPPHDFDKYSEDVFKNIEHDDDIYFIEKDHNGTTKASIYSKKPTYGFYCQLSNSIVNLFKNVFDNPFYSLIILSTSSAILFIFLSVRRWIWERRQVNVAFNLALMRLSERKQIIGLEFREEAFAHVTDPMERQKLFQMLDAKVRAYPYVRAGNTRYSGFEAGYWEWKGYLKNIELLLESKRFLLNSSEIKTSSQKHKKRKIEPMSDMSEDDIIYLDSDLNFTDVVAEKDRKKSYEVDFTVHSVEGIVKNQDDEVNHVSNILGIQKQHAATLLRHFRWNKERLIERYMDDSGEVLHKAGVITDNTRTPKFIKIPGFMCDICCDDDEDLFTLALSCGHRFCRNCYEHYLTQKIKEEGESRRILCMANNCNVIVDEKTVDLAVNKDIHERYRTLLNRTYVDDNEYLRWCPAPSCEYAIECHVLHTSLITIVPTVECACSHRFCFGCGLADHQPSICVLVKKWVKKCEDDSETANWISAHTKECGKCHSTIEKNGGCNHMTCRKCKYEFCWVCMGPWSEHGTSWYNCNRYDEKTSIDARDQQAKSRASLERYLH